MSVSVSDPMSDPVPPVTVLVATRDRLELLRRALSSIWAQDYPGEIHVVCVFDGAVPENHALTAPVAGSAAGPRQLTVLANPGPIGLPGARNAGLDRARHDLVATCDDDDTWLPDKLSRQVALAVQHPEAVAIGGGIRVHTAGRTVDRPAPKPTVVMSDLLCDRIMELHPSTLLMRADRLRAIGGWDAHIPGGYAEDYDLLLRLTRRGPIRCVDGIVAEILWAGQSHYFSRWQMIADGLRYLLEAVPEFATQPRGRARIHGQIAVALSASGDRRGTRQHVRLSRADHRWEPRALLAQVIAGRPARAEAIQRRLHAHGRGI